MGSGGAGAHFCSFSLVALMLGCMREASVFQHCVAFVFGTEFGEIVDQYLEELWLWMGKHRLNESMPHLHSVLCSTQAFRALKWYFSNSASHSLHSSTWPILTETVQEREAWGVSYSLTE